MKEKSISEEKGMAEKNRMSGTGGMLETVIYKLSASHEESHVCEPEEEQAASIRFADEKQDESQEEIRGLRELAWRLSEEGVACIDCQAFRRRLSEGMNQMSDKGKECLTDQADAEMYAGIDMQRLLFLTDDRALAKQASVQGIACIGVGDPEEDYFEGTELVLMSLEEADRQYLEEFLLRFHGLPVVIAETEHLLIREMIPNDFEELYRISEQEGMELARRDADGGNSFEPQRLSAYARQQYRLYGYGLWTVLQKESKKTMDVKNTFRVIGCCGFSEFEPDFELKPETEANGDSVYIEESDQNGMSLEMQYMLDEAFRGQGLGTEMCEAALTYAKERLEAETVWVRVHPQNAGAFRFAERLGFVSALTSGEFRYMIKNKYTCGGLFCVI